jgi:NAD(P)-dependent dehydrogenase (short-subunit alcohol dehydrogenase family)
VNISSRAAAPLSPGPYPPTARGAGGAAYGATKAALERFTQGLAREVAAQKISVNALSPQLVNWSEGGHYFRSMSGARPSNSGMRMDGKIIGDATVVICAQEAGAYTGNILYDELVMRGEGGLSDDEIARLYPIEP